MFIRTQEDWGKYCALGYSTDNGFKGRHASLNDHCLKSILEEFSQPSQQFAPYTIFSGLGQQDFMVYFVKFFGVDQVDDNHDIDFFSIVECLKDCVHMF